MRCYIKTEVVSNPADWYHRYVALRWFTLGKRSKFANVGAFAILIFDFCITVQDEVEWTWSRPWDITRVIFAISRYLPFIGSGLTVYDELSVVGSPARGQAENMIHIISIVAAEGLLVIRTWAFWQRSKRMLIGLVTYSVVTVIAATSINVLRNQQLTAVSNAVLVYAFLTLFESVILVLTAYKKFSDYRKFNSSIIITLYGGSMFYMLCIIAITVTNMVINAVFPVGYTNLLDTLQVVIHSVLASRIMFHLRSSHDLIYGMHTSSTSMVSEAIQYRQPSQMQTNDSERMNDASSEV
ncbi:hypothetical protein BD769DRAFT_1670046 [Suillus cothurnatus]|nr:hypothetical protein BD769DRAFT_1670046 [Suillus cothurnatus]